jgi:hypothetical protein
MQWEVTLRQLENTQKGAFLQTMLHTTQHVFLFQEIINPN